MSTSRFRLPTATPLSRTPLSDTHSYTPVCALSPTTPTPSSRSSRFTAYTEPETPTNAKRRYPQAEEGDENSVPGAARPPNLPKKRCYTPRRNEQEKLRDALKGIEGTGWNLGEFLYHVFRSQDQAGNSIHRDKSHSKFVSRFLQGESKYTPAMILKEWYKHPDGRISEGSVSKKHLYSISPAYTEMKNVRAMLTSFAVQVVEEKLVREAKAAVHPSNGLHA